MSESSACKGCCPSSRTQPWPSWVPAWTAPLGLPRWICGFGNWVGGIKKTLFAAEQNRPDVVEKRAKWHERLAVETAARLVFVDESGANTKMTRLRGRALGGQRLVARIRTDTIKPARSSPAYAGTVLAPLGFLMAP